MSTLSRTIKNFFKVGPRSYFRQLKYIGDTKWGKLVGTDKAGNKFYENNEELPLRTRWVDFKRHDFDAAQIEPGWHGWISYLYSKPPTEDPTLLTKTRGWETKEVISNPTQTRGAFKTYSTVKPKIESMAWVPKAVDRGTAKAQASIGTPRY